MRSEKKENSSLAIQHVLVLLFCFLPAGEVLGAWLGMKWGQRRSPEIQQKLRQNWAFQTSWLLMRGGLMALAMASVIFSAGQVKNAAENQIPQEWFPPSDPEPEGDINIPGEPQEPSTPTEPLQNNKRHPKSWEHLDRLQKDLRQEQIDLLTLPHSANWVLRILIAGSVGLCLWLVSLILTLRNLIRLWQGQQAVYPLTWSWLLKQKRPVTQPL
ncbi:MAG: hypothetical protein AB7N80_14095 [Bdellovibrionales bacterium]